MLKLLSHGVAFCVLTAPTMADEVVLKDGRVLVGTTRTVGKLLQIETLDGTVRVPVDEVERIRTDEQLREALQEMAMRSGAGSSHAQLELARVAKRWGLHEEMWLYLGKALRGAGNSDVMRRRAREFMAGLEREVLPKKWRTATPEIKVRELLNRLRRTVPAAKSAAVAELLAQVPDSDKHLRTRARRMTQTPQRVASLRALAHRPTEGNDRFVYRTALLDGAEQVRKASMQIAKELGRTKAAVDYLAGGLLQDNARFRIRTAEAFAELGDEAAVPLLVAAGPLAHKLRKEGLPGGATRAHMAVISQISFIRDFDVEVAQASFIADPKVDVLTAGTVLDVTVLSVRSHTVEIVNAYRRAIKRIAGAEPGPDTRTWAEWLEKRQLAQATPNRPR